MDPIRPLLAIALALLMGCQDQEPKKAKIADTLKTYTIAQMMDNESIRGGSFSADNSKVLVSSNSSGIYNMYSINAENGKKMALTQSDSVSIFAISYYPEDDRILFRMDGNGDEIYHIYEMDTTGTITDLTPVDGARSLFYDWSDNGTSFFYTSNKRDSRKDDLYEYNITTGTSDLLYANDDNFRVELLSGDKKFLALSKSLNTNDSDLYILERKTGKVMKINEDQSANSAADFSPDGDYLYYTTDEGAEFDYLMRYNLKTGSKEKIMERQWDIQASSFSENGAFQITYINEDAKNTVEVRNTETGKPLSLPNLEGVSITSLDFSRDGTMMYYFAGGSHTPSNLFTHNLETGESKQLSDVLNPDIQKEDLVRAEVIRYTSFDGLEIPAIYYKPHQADSDHKVPALVWVHGGPGGQSRQTFNSFVQYMVNHGYAILAVNNRGSSGYGKTFYQMDDLNHGDKDLKDCVAGKDWLAARPEIAEDKIGIIGGSYGGYMTMAALTYTPEEFAVGVNLFGVTNWIRTLRSIPPWWESFKDALYLELGNPNTADSVRLKAISPLFHTDKVTKPLIVLQGSQDPRVLQVESDEIVAGVRENGVPVEYVLFEDEGHGFVKKENQITAYSKVLEFLDIHLKGDKGTPIDDK